MSPAALDASTQGQLGCGTNTAAIYDRCGNTLITKLDDQQCIAYQRELDVCSAASVTVGRSGECCDVLGDIEPWRHVLVCYRDGVPVWEGPILKPQLGVNSTTIIARDHLAWFDRRRIREKLTVSGTNVEIARALINYGITDPAAPGVDDTCMGDYVEYYEGDRNTYTYTWEAMQTTVGAELRNLAKGSLNFVTVGRRLVVWSALALSRTNMVQDKHLLGEPTVTVDGYSMASWAGSLGNGVTASCGGRDPYYGRLDRVISNDSITDVASAKQLACIGARSNTRPNITLDIPDGVRLDPSTPVTFDQLVPGVIMPFWSDSTCRTVNADMALTKVAVQEGCSDDNDGDELVAITVGPRSLLADGDVTVVSDL